MNMMTGSIIMSTGELSILHRVRTSWPWCSSFVDRDMMMLFMGGGIGHSIRYDEGGVSMIDSTRGNDEDGEDLHEELTVPQ
jgi:hypothetical protein